MNTAPRSRRDQQVAMFAGNLHGRGIRARLDARIVLAELDALHRDTEGPLQGWPSPRDG